MFTQELIEKLRNAKQIVLKVNVDNFRDEKGCTHTNLLRDVCRRIRCITGAPLIVADGATHGTWAAFREHGYGHLPKEFTQLTLLDMNNDEPVGEYRIAKTIFQSDVRISFGRWVEAIVVREAVIFPHGRCFPDSLSDIQKSEIMNVLPPDFIIT